MSTESFGWETTAEEAIAGIDVQGIRAIVTSGTSGIGAETARVLAAAGAHATIAARNLDAGRAVAARITRQHPGAVASAAALELFRGGDCSGGRQVSGGEQDDAFAQQLRADADGPLASVS